MVAYPLGLKFRDEFSLEGTTDLSSRVYLSVYSLLLLVIAGCGSVTILFVIFLRPGTAPQPEPGPPFSRLTLDLEYEKIMAEIRWREMTGKEGLSK